MNNTRKKKWEEQTEDVDERAKTDAKKGAKSGSKKDKLKTREKEAKEEVQNWEKSERGHKETELNIDTRKMIKKEGIKEDVDEGGKGTKDNKHKC